MELDAIHSMMAEGDQAEEIVVMTEKFNCGHRRSQHMEDSAGGRPSSPRDNSVDEAAASNECICSTPQGLLV